MQRTAVRRAAKKRGQKAGRRVNIALVLTGGLCILIVLTGLLIGVGQGPLLQFLFGSGHSLMMQSSPQETGGGALEDSIFPSTGSAGEESPSGFDPGGSDGKGGLTG